MLPTCPVEHQLWNNKLINGYQIFLVLTSFSGWCVDLHKAAILQHVKVDVDIEQQRLFSIVDEKWILHQLVVVVRLLLDTHIFAVHFGFPLSIESTAREG